MIFSCLFRFESVSFRREDHSANATNGGNKAPVTAVGRYAGSDSNFNDFLFLFARTELFLLFLLHKLLYPKGRDFNKVKLLFISTK